MKMFAPATLLISLMAGGPVYAAATTSINNSMTNMCGQWGLSSNDLATCNQQWTVARSDADRDAVQRRFNPSYNNVSSTNGNANTNRYNNTPGSSGSSASLGARPNGSASGSAGVPGAAGAAPSSGAGN